jgi:hypothetical protein
MNTLDNSELMLEFVPDGFVSSGEELLPAYIGQVYGAADADGFVAVKVRDRITWINDRNRMVPVVVDHSVQLESPKLLEVVTPPRGTKVWVIGKDIAGPIQPYWAIGVLD